MATSNEDLAIGIAEVRTMLAERQSQVSEAMARSERALSEFRREIKNELDIHRAETEKKFGELTVKLGSIETDSRDVRDTMLLTKGGWKVLVAIGGLTAAVGAFFAKIPWEKFLGSR